MTDSAGAVVDLREEVLVDRDLPARVVVRVRHHCRIPPFLDVKRPRRAHTKAQ